MIRQTGQAARYVGRVDERKPHARPLLHRRGAVGTQSVSRAVLPGGVMSKTRFPELNVAAGWTERTLVSEEIVVL